MKRIIMIIILLLMFGCSQNQTHTTYISKYFETTSLVNNALELFNDSDKEIQLKNYSIKIFQNGALASTYDIPLVGEIKMNSYFLLTTDKATNQELIDNSDQRSEDLLFNGNDAIGLYYHDELIDVVGDIGSSLDFGKDVSMIRKANYQTPSNVFNAYHFIAYSPNYFEAIKQENHPFKTNKDMLEGPTLTDDYRLLPFIDSEDSSIGGGGAIEVTLDQAIDGDTAYFYSLDQLTYYKVRFYFIDTKEVAGTGSPNGQPWGYPASYFTKKILNDAKSNHQKIEIQSIKGYALKDQYDRYLALVWVDSQLVNYMVVRAGLSDVHINYTNDLYDMQNNHIPYHGYLQDAWFRAKAQQWGIHSASDHNWNYDTNKPILPISNIPPLREYDALIDG